MEVDCWRPRASLQAEIKGFFLGGSVRIHKLEEITRTQFVDSNGYCDIVNRFGLETEDAGKIHINLNLCLQDMKDRKTNQGNYRMIKGKEKLEARKLVMKY